MDIKGLKKNRIDLVGQCEADRQCCKNEHKRKDINFFLPCYAIIKKM
jgi:hypothetical protein